MGTVTMIEPHECRIRSWQQFARDIRKSSNPLLSRLDDYPRSILVTGCQRSGGTMLARLITRSDGMVNYWFGRDDELDAALILCGHVREANRGRYCFQTTYLNECYPEYMEHRSTGNKLVWSLRNPYSVVYSMMYNWRRFALDELFLACGERLLVEDRRKWFNLFGTWGVSKIEKACLAYNGKVAQLFELRQRLNSEELMVIEYDDLVRNKVTALPAIYCFIDLPYRREYENFIKSSSLKKSDRLSNWEKSLVTELCVPVYKQAMTLLTPFDK